MNICFLKLYDLALESTLVETTEQRTMVQTTQKRIQFPSYEVEEQNDTQILIIISLVANSIKTSALVYG